MTNDPKRCPECGDDGSLAREVAGLRERLELYHVHTARAMGRELGDIIAEARAAGERAGLERCEKMLRERAAVSTWGETAAHARLVHLAAANLIGSWLREWENITPTSKASTLAPVPTETCGVIVQGGCGCAVLPTGLCTMGHYRRPPAERVTLPATVDEWNRRHAEPGVSAERVTVPAGEALAGTVLDRTETYETRVAWEGNDLFIGRFTPGGATVMGMTLLPHAHVALAAFLAAPTPAAAVPTGAGARVPPMAGDDPRAGDVYLVGEAWERELTGVLLFGGSAWETKDPGTEGANKGWINAKELGTEIPRVRRGAP